MTFEITLLTQPAVLGMCIAERATPRPAHTQTSKPTVGVFAVTPICRLSPWLLGQCQDQAVVRKSLLPSSHSKSSLSALGLSVRLHLRYLAFLWNLTHYVHNAFSLTAVLSSGHTEKN